MAETFESRKPDECADCVDLWGVHYCRLVGIPCAKVEECPRRKGQSDG